MKMMKDNDWFFRIYYIFCNHIWPESFYFLHSNIRKIQLRSYILSNFAFVSCDTFDFNEFFC